MPYIKASISLEMLNDILSNHAHLVTQSRAGKMYLPINIEISRLHNAMGKNVTIRPYQGRHNDSSLVKNLPLGFGETDIPKLTQDLKDIWK